MNRFLITAFAVTLFLSCQVAVPAQQIDVLPGFDPNSIEHIHSAADAERLRAQLVETIWHSEELPASQAEEINEVPPLKVEADNLAGSIVLRRPMEFGIASLMYYYKARRFSDCLLIYHSGHNEGVSDLVKQSLWSRVIGGGCDLLYVAMPLMDQNPQPVVETPYGPLLLRTHDALALLELDEFNPIKVFVDPVLSALNYLEKQRNYRFVFMTGLSGGGWTTTLYAALDPRISASFPVAGSLPEIDQICDRD